MGGGLSGIGKIAIPRPNSLVNVEIKKMESVPLPLKVSLRDREK